MKATRRRGHAESRSRDAIPRFQCNRTPSTSIVSPQFGSCSTPFETRRSATLNRLACQQKLFLLRQRLTCSVSTVPGIGRMRSIDRKIVGIVITDIETVATASFGAKPSIGDAGHAVERGTRLASPPTGTMGRCDDASPRCTSPHVQRSVSALATPASAGCVAHPAHRDAACCAAGFRASEVRATPTQLDTVRSTMGNGIRAVRPVLLMPGVRVLHPPAIAAAVADPLPSDAASGGLRTRRAT